MGLMERFNVSDEIRYNFQKKIIRRGQVVLIFGSCCFENILECTEA